MSFLENNFVITSMCGSKDAWYLPPRPFSLSKHRICDDIARFLSTSEIRLDPTHHNRSCILDRVKKQKIL